MTLTHSANPPSAPSGRAGCRAAMESARTIPESCAALACGFRFIVRGRVMKKRLPRCRAVGRNLRDAAQYSLDGNDDDFRRAMTKAAKHVAWFELSIKADSFSQEWKAAFGNLLAQTGISLCPAEPAGYVSGPTPPLKDGEDEATARPDETSLESELCAAAR